MGKLDYGKLASGLKLSSEKDDPADDDSAGPDEADAPGAMGDKALAAIKANNGEAFEEAIRSIKGG